MNTSKSIYLLPLVCVSLISCGGGSNDNNSSGGENGESYLPINGSDNGTIILDGRNEKFAVLASSRSFVRVNDKNISKEMTMRDQGKVIANGTQVGNVVLRSTDNGLKVATLVCTTGSAMTINVNGGNWSYSCGSTNPNPGNPTPNPGPGSGSYETGPNSNGCIRSYNDSNGYVHLKNNCNQLLTLGWCYTSAENGSVASKYLCTPQPSNYSPTGYDYKRQSGGWSPGVDHMILSESNLSGRFIACAAPYIIPILTETGGYCVKP